MDVRVTTVPVEVRTVGDADVADVPRRLGGIVVRYNERTLIDSGWERFTEEIAPGAFADSLDGDITALWGHDHRAPLGRTSNGTLRLLDGPDALQWEVDLPDVTWAADLLALVNRRDVVGMSFGFVPEEVEWQPARGGAPAHARVVKAVLHHVAPVTHPAYPGGAVEARASARATEMIARYNAWKSAARARALRRLLDARGGR